MHEAELHDLSDDSDYAASQQQASGSVMRCDSGKSAVSEPNGSEVVYSKDNVTIHPTQYASERISGRLLLVKQGSLFMSWIPYKASTDGVGCVGRSSNSGLTEKDRSLYTIKSVPLSDVRSIRRHTPTLGWQYIIVVLSSGLAFPPLYFYSGGVREFLATLKQHIFIMRSADDANVFLVNDFEDPLQKSLSSLELPGVVSVANRASLRDSLSSVSSADNSERGNQETYDGSASTSEYSMRHKHKAYDPARDLSIQVLEKFSLVTKFARETTSQLFRESHNNGFSPYEKRQQNNYDSPNSVGGRPTDVPKNADVISVASDPLEFDKLPLVWGKQREPPLCLEEWAAFLDSEGRVMDSKAFRKRIFYGGVEHNLRKEVWKYLLGYHEYDSTYAEREYLAAVKKSEYDIIKSQWQNDICRHNMADAMSSAECMGIDTDTQVLDCGTEPYAGTTWQMLCRRLSAWVLTLIPKSWIVGQSISATQAKRFTKFRERKGLIEKDVVRTDRSVSYYEGEDNPNVAVLRDILLTYSFYNFDLGYCQGMSDLLSPILYVMKDESESFWCFVALMERLGPNFNRDQNGMHSQLLALSKLVELLDSPLHNYLKQADCLNYFFCFRWILIQFKREFEYTKVMHLWEVLWTHYLSEHFHLYMCVAVLKRYRKKIMGEQMDFDTLLKFINELSGHIDLDGMIRDAEALCVCAGESGAACIPPGTPPSLPVETDMGLYPQEDDIL